MKKVLPYTKDYYPEVLGQLLIVNSPMLFEAIWNNIKPQIDEQTRKKITIIGSGYKDKLFEIVDQDNIPNFLGGKSNDCITKNIGPWNLQGENLFTKEDLPVQENNNNEEQSEQDVEREALDLVELRNALQGKVVESAIKPPHNPQKYENHTTQGAKFQVSDTPLNTQADEDHNYVG
ncbi:hypothetical protein IMG5_187880 [Ichthyophthirius multifiliis]|uniref:CRAL-TRIO domain-containing protein n=1 Tax=Ichthyophthirius multifiliis TaxID=5932 RepID=G0R3W7_ICHMU|nr:hypothetical protein IMG5_187880 [Ichthyophthirius multifiliis]EGR27843.1 hypothetical protein IMG5_187880 [Ichthyophthirius multifiliis]|eukprot:XP_004027188.1 hypothetical protein IMG5_187880 [Ichthyophthirius multifiliis]